MRRFAFACRRLGIDLAWELRGRPVENESRPHHWRDRPWGAYRAALPLSHSYEARCIKRRMSLFNADRVDHLYQIPQVANARFRLRFGEPAHNTNLMCIVQPVSPTRSTTSAQ